MPIHSKLGRGLVTEFKPKLLARCLQGAQGGARRICQSCVRTDIPSAGRRRPSKAPNPEEELKLRSAAPAEVGQSNSAAA